MKPILKVKNGYVLIQNRRIHSNPIAEVLFNTVLTSERVQSTPVTSFKQRSGEIKTKFNHVFKQPSQPLEYHLRPEGMKTLERFINHLQTAKQ